MYMYEKLYDTWAIIATQIASEAPRVWAIELHDMFDQITISFHLYKIPKFCAGKRGVQHLGFWS